MRTSKEQEAAFLAFYRVWNLVALKITGFLRLFCFFTNITGFAG